MKTSRWIAFSALMLAMAGLFALLLGLVAVVESEVFVVTEDEIIALNLTAWGWLHIVIGSIALGTGIAVQTQAPWAIFLGMLLAMLSASTQVLFLTVVPWWSLTIIAIDMLVVYGLVVHGPHTRLRTSL